MAALELAARERVDVGDTDLVTAGVLELGRMIRTGETSPVEITKACLSRIERIDSKLNSFITVTAEAALAQAAAVEAELAAGLDRGPFHGIPYALKDNVDTAGVLSSSHSRIFIDRVPQESATVARKLEAAGGILIGKTATFEFAIGGPSFDLPWPPARNPWNPDYLPGGSSSGSGAAVGGRLVPAAIGTDTGGSIRWPAAMCGITGLKPTYGRISRRGVHPNTFSLDHCGPMARSAADCAAMLGACAGYDPLDPGSIDAPVPDYTAALTGSIKGLRIGLVRHWYEEEATDEVIAAVDDAVEVLRQLGAVVEPLTLDPLRDYVDAKTTISITELFAVHEADIRFRPQDFGRLLRSRVMVGGLVRAEDYVQAMRWRAELSTRMMAAFSRYDLLVTAGWMAPADPAVPDGVDFFKKRQLVTMPFSLAGLPALALPCGFSSKGLPLSLQIAGRPFDEATVLRAGDAYQQATEWHLAVPNLD
ncbi:amidase [Azorhizobium caulinodans ORS 571]|uniref:Indoleacetamide hydrolase n=1 Tax=Azorhizobium caulinodans (strain ATCC 43989 / DSM 5975 / JCM 20966 / LMG 6465 / NBRC 14845 / NCIMB 13405 / ORS 571) TaxID=438753 RepID=A8IB80_AZOC5|nr:Asp-tRNA(Asn)/Glu-tRNA(Gln) amidotransferase GatCAB subunit A [Azorhizobium caulinodans]BAF88621.1 amidase [Azorhizobium caulinodans ORS 571]